MSVGLAAGHCFRFANFRGHDGKDGRLLSEGSMVVILAGMARGEAVYCYQRKICKPKVDKSLSSWGHLLVSLSVCHPHCSGYAHFIKKLCEI